MSIDIKNGSRLRFADLLLVDGVEFWDTLVLPDAAPRQDDIQHVVSQSDRIDLLANRYYQDPAMWWVIAWANNLEILPTDMKEGMQLRIPSKSFATAELTRRTGKKA